MLPKFAVIAVLAAALGVAGGVLAVHSQTSPGLDELEQVRIKLEQEHEALERQAALARERAERMDQRNAELQQHVLNLESQLQETRATMAQSTPAAVQQTEAELEAVDGPEGTEVAAGPGGQRQAAMNRGRPDPDEMSDEERAEWEERREERRQEWEARQQERAERMREGIDNFMQERIAQTNDPAAQRRLAEIGQYSQQLMDLRREARAAETEGEQELFRDAARETAEYVAGLVRDHRDAELRSMAAEYGIDPDVQQEFLRQYQRVQREDPLLRMGAGGGRGGGLEGMAWRLSAEGGGPGGGRGGRGN